RHQCNPPFALTPADPGQGSGRYYPHDNLHGAEGSPSLPPAPPEEPAPTRTTLEHRMVPEAWPSRGGWWWHGICTIEAGARGSGGELPPAGGGNRPCRPP